GFGIADAKEGNAEEMGDYFSNIDISGNRLLTLLNDLLDLAKLETGKQDFSFRQTDLVAVINPVIRELNSLLLESSLHVNLQTQDNAPKVSVDAPRIHQVMQNLLSNAIKFSPSDSEIVVEISCDNSANAPFVEIVVRDSGPGIPDDELEFIFGNFAQSSTTRSGAGGTGLGLAISRQIVEAHGGAVIARNAAAGGAEFVVTLPTVRSTISAA
ncbi:MAG: ATP-binding protein, partial [Planctomycetota bacterium]